MPLNLKKLKKTKCLKTLTCGEVFKLIFLLFLKTNHDAPPQLPPMPCWFPPNFSVYTLRATPTAQKMKFSIIDFFSKCDHIWLHLLKISVIENFIFCAVPREKPVPSNTSWFPLLLHSMACKQLRWALQFVIGIGKNLAAQVVKVIQIRCKIVLSSKWSSVWWDSLDKNLKMKRPN